MKKNRFAILLAILLAAGSTAVQAQFSGSDGTDGAIDITVDTTLTLPPDGIFNATTITVAATATLSFTKNGNNTPVYLLATGDIVIEGNIDVRGQNGTAAIGGPAGPGGFDGGVPGFGGDPPGDGYGPGAGQHGGTNGGHASYGGTPVQSSALNGPVYGSPLQVPLVGGSGGGGATPPSAGGNGGGGGGGGAILLASDTRVVINGTITARGGGHGGSGGPGCGSGGAIRIVGPTVEGTGTLRVTGGSVGAWIGGPGRIRFDLIDRTGIGALTRDPISVEAVGSFMTAFVPNFPKLDVIEVAGQTIPEGSGPVDITLPFGTPATQTVIVQGRDFTGLVPIRITLTPDSGDPVVLDTDIDMTTGNPAQVSVSIDFPLNVRVKVHAWTR